MEKEVSVLVGPLRHVGQHRLLSAVIYAAISIGLLQLSVLLPIIANAIFGDGTIVEQFKGTILNAIISGNVPVTRTIHMPDIGSGISGNSPTILEVEQPKKRLAVCCQAWIG